MAVGWSLISSYCWSVQDLCCWVWRLAGTSWFCCGKAFLLENTWPSELCVHSPVTVVVRDYCQEHTPRTDGVPSSLFSRLVLNCVYWQWANCFKVLLHLFSVVLLDFDNIESDDIQIGLRCALGMPNTTNTCSIFTVRLTGAGVVVMSY